MSWPRTALLLALSGAIVGSGCGYTLGLDTHGAGVRTVAVTVADNRTFRQGVEIPLTKAILEALAQHTDLRPAPRGTADAVLVVEIADIRGRNLVGAGATPVREGALDYRVRARMVDARTGAVLRDRRILDRAEFRIPVGETEASATDEAVSDLARKIVLALEGDI